MLRKMKLKEWKLYKIFRQAASWPADQSNTARFTYSNLKAGNIRQSKAPTWGGGGGGLDTSPPPATGLHEQVSK